MKLNVHLPTAILGNVRYANNIDFSYDWLCLVAIRYGINACQHSVIIDGNAIRVVGEYRPAGCSIRGRSFSTYT